MFRIDKTLNCLYYVYLHIIIQKYPLKLNNPIFHNYPNLQNVRITLVTNVTIDIN